LTALSAETGQESDFRRDNEGKRRPARRVERFGRFDDFNAIFFALRDDERLTKIRE